MLTEIAEALGMSIILDKIDGDGYLIEFGRSCAEILVKADAESTRRRFTIAHELGHWVVNRSMEKCACRSSKTSNIESWCNRFAASLLLPTSWIYRFVGQYTQLGDSRVVFSGSSVFRVSRTTFYRRLHDIYGIIFVEIGSNDSVKLWPRYYEHSHRISEPYRENLLQSISKYRNRFHDSAGTIEGYVSAGPIALEFRRYDNQLVCRPAVLLLKRINSGQKTTSLSEFLDVNRIETIDGITIPSHTCSRLGNHNVKDA